MPAHLDGDSLYGYSNPSLTPSRQPTDVSYTDTPTTSDVSILKQRAHQKTRYETAIKPLEQISPLDRAIDLLQKDIDSSAPETSPSNSLQSIDSNEFSTFRPGDSRQNLVMTSSSASSRANQPRKTSSVTFMDDPRVSIYSSQVCLTLVCHKVIYSSQVCLTLVCQKVVYSSQVCLTLVCHNVIYSSQVCLTLVCHKVIYSSQVCLTLVCQNVIYSSQVCLTLVCHKAVYSSQVCLTVCHKVIFLSRGELGRPLIFSYFP